MRKPLHLIKRKWRSQKYRRPFLVEGFKHVYKVYPEPFRHEATNALRSEGLASSPVFRDFHCVIPRTFLKLGGTQLHKTRRVRYVENMDALSVLEREEIVASAIGNIPDSCRRQPWHWFLQAEKLAGFLGQIGQKRAKYLTSALHNVSFPVTGAHGDFGGTNVLLDKDGGKHLIDWDDCNPEGSFYHDALQAFLRMCFPCRREMNRRDWRSLRLASLARLEKSNLGKLSALLGVANEALVSWHIVLHGTISFNPGVSGERQVERLKMLARFLDERLSNSQMRLSSD